jgi:hypothetical protein
MILLVLPLIYTWSCGPSLDYDDARFMLFRQELAGSDALSPFYYTQHFLFSNTPDPEGTDVQRNCKEWEQACGHKVSTKDVYTMLYSVTPDSFLYACRTDDWKDLGKNSFVKWLRQKDNIEYLRYLAFARSVESQQVRERDPWKENNDKFYLSFYDSLAQIARMQGKTSASNFLKERYAFQAVKLMYYGKYYSYTDADHDMGYGIEMDNTQLIKCYETYLKGKKTIVADWALLYYGASFKNRITRARYLLQAFDRTEEKKVFVYNHLRLADVNALEKVTTDAQTLAVIHAYKAIKSPGRTLKEIQLVYKYDSGSRYLPLLITREINKVEDWILSPEAKGFNSAIREQLYNKEKGRTANDPYVSYNRFSKKNIEKDRLYLRQVRTFLLTLLNNKSAIGDDLLRLAVAHLYHVDGNYSEAKTYLDNIHDLKNPDWEIQLDIEKTISLIYTRDLRNDTTRKELNKAFTRLEKAGVMLDTSTQYNYDYYGRQKDIVSDLYLLLSNRMRAQGDIVTSGLLSMKSRSLVNEYYGFPDYHSWEVDTAENYSKIAWFDKYATPADVDSLMMFKHKKKKTAFERRITPAIWGKDNFYRDLKGTLLVRQGQFEEALAVMNQIPDDFWERHYAYKEYLRHSSVTSVGTLLPVETGLRNSYPVASKKLILRDIVALRSDLKNARTDSARARIYFMLGNSLYNISYHGKDWMMFSYGKTSMELDKNDWDEDYRWAYFSFYPNNIRYGKTYYTCAGAIKMYLSALRFTHNDKELAAQCLLMLSACDNAAATYRYRGKTHYSEYLGMLKKKYKKTVVFDRASTECPDVEAYLAKFGG